MFIARALDVTWWEEYFTSEVYYFQNFISPDWSREKNIGQTQIEELLLKTVKVIKTIKIWENVTAKKA